MIHLIPGDPARTMLGVHATPEAVARLHKQWGLDQPLINQYLDFMNRLLHGDLGESLFYNLDVKTLLMRAGRADAVAAGHDHDLRGDHRGAAGHAGRDQEGQQPRPGDPRRADVRAGHAPLLGGDHPDPAVRPASRAAVPRRRLRRRADRPHPLDDPARLHGRAVHLADPDPQPAGQPAERARVRLHHHRPLQGHLRAARRHPPRCPQRHHLDGHRARPEHRLPGGRHAGDREGVRAARHRQP